MGDEMQITRSAFLLLALALAGSAARADEPAAGLSGLARIAPATYLGVLDWKRDEPGKRLAILQVGPEAAISRRKLDPPRWPGGPRPSDLEAACALTGRPGEALVVESGEDGPSARLFHVGGLLGPGGVRALRAVEVRAAGGAQNLEGLACVPRSDGRWLVILGERGGSERQRAGILRWGVLDLASGHLAFSKAGSAGIAVAPPRDWTMSPAARAIADLHLAADGVLWAAATVDPGDAGPFRSAVYAAADVDPSREPALRATAAPVAAWRLDGLKVEGLAAPPELLGSGAALLVASEDEALGGVVRPLPILK
jgi:hypothetical protein